MTDEFHAVIRDADGQIVGVRRPKPAEPDPAQVALTASITEATARRLGDVVERLDRAAQIDIEAVQHAARVEQEAKVAFTAGHQQMREAEAIALQAGVALAHARRERAELEMAAEGMIEAALSFGFRVGFGNARAFPGVDLHEADAGLSERLTDAFLAEVERVGTSLAAQPVGQEPAADRD